VKISSLSFSRGVSSMALLLECCDVYRKYRAA
jgi:hypothetical protein